MKLPRESALDLSEEEEAGWEIKLNDRARSSAVGLRRGDEKA